MPQYNSKIKKTLRLFGILGALFGFIGDVLQPIAPFSSYIFFATAFTTVTGGIAVFLKSSLRTKGMPALMFSGFMMVSSGLLYTFQDENNKESGVIASVVPGISKLQSSLGIIQEDISEIKESAKRIEESSVRTEKTVKLVEKNTQETAEATKKIAGSIDAVFNELLKGGGIVKNPTKPEEFYANARMYEQKGDSGNARRSYVKFFTFHLDYIDPHLRYQKYLKIQEGRAGAREIYSIMYENDQRPIMEFARIILFDSPKRTKMLEEFVSKKPNFGFAYLELSKEFSELRTGVSTIKNLRKEYDYLVKFMDLYNKGTIARLFLDKVRLSELVSTADSRIKILKASLEKTEDPVSVSVYPEVKRHTKTTRALSVRPGGDKYFDTTILNTVWKISVQIIENAEDPKIVLVNGESKKPIAVESQSSSLKTSVFHFFIKDEEFGGNSFLTVSYVNSSGETSGPYKVLLSKEDYIVSFLKKIAAEDQDLDLVLSQNSTGIPGFPFAHLFKNYPSNKRGDMLRLIEEKKTYLGIAAKKNYIDVAKWLLKNGADPNIYPRPLIVSIKNGHLSMVRLLAKNGADVNGVGGGPCPLELAMGIKETQLKQGMVELLEEYGAKYYASSSRHC